MINYESYVKSISDELNSTKDRVNNFIGNNHGGESGRYREIVLTNILRNRIPDQVSIGTGFVINNNNNDISKQIDVIIYRNTYPVLFKIDNFVIVDSNSVLGIIEVKSTFRKNELDDILQKSNKNGQILKKNIFNGIFFYRIEGGLLESDGSIKDSVRDNLKNNLNSVDHISIGPKYFVKQWEKDDYIYKSYDDLEKVQNDMFRVYEIEKLSFGYFISNLIDFITNEIDIKMNTSFEKFLYPIDEGKESHCIATIEK